MSLQLPDLKNSWKKYKFFWGILIVIILLRLPSLFDPYSYGDEGIYLTLGEGIRRGLLLYRDIYDNKPPLLYLLAAVSGSLFWFRFLLLVTNLATLYLFSLLVKTLFPAKVKVQKIALIILGLLSTLPLIEGNIANAEIFMILPIIGAVFLFFSQKPSLRSYFLVGLLFSLATLFKIPAGFDFAAILIFYIFFFTNRKNYKQSLKFSLCSNYKLYILNSTFLILGFFLPVLITLVYFWSQGALGHYFTAAFAQNLPYLSSWGGQAKSGFTNSGLLIRALLLLIFLGGLCWKQKNINRSLVFVSIWFVFSLFAALLSGRPYPHYLIQVLPSFSFLVAILFSQPKAKEKFLSFLFLGILFLSIVYFRFWAYPVFPYYQNFLAFALGQKNQEDYFRWFNPKVPQTYQLAQFLVTHTESNEKVFIWGDSPVIYALSRRLPPVRYTASYHIIDLKAYRETIEALEKEKPRFIIDLHDEPRPFPELDILLDQNYLSSSIIGQAEIFRLTPR